MTLEIGLPEVSAGVILFAALQYLTSIWISERLKTSLQKEHSTFLENLKWDLKVREQAVRVAEYLAFARNLKNAGNATDCGFFPLSLRERAGVRVFKKAQIMTACSINT